ncbi:MAG: hypothetical protein K8S23_02280 [Candidatus Cloacimonetes bacterium]|nr:hypothetical protein [Candidatus Cloacimonadota bacterium]
MKTRILITIIVLAIMLFIAFNAYAQAGWEIDIDPANGEVFMRGMSYNHTNDISTYYLSCSENN